MRRVFAMLVAAAMLGAAGAQAGTRPIMRATRVTPLTVVGIQFPRAVWLRVTASAGTEKQTRVVRTSATGRFITAFAVRVAFCKRSTLVVARRAGSLTILADLKVLRGKCP